MKTFLIVVIQGYRRWISPCFPPCCRFHPTCSQYALEAISIHGAWRGGWLAVKRLAKCHPFHRQKTILVDPVPVDLGKNKRNSP